MEVLRETESFCPVCKRVIPAKLVAVGNEVKIKKTCPEHGDFEDTYWGNPKHYKWVMKFQNDGSGISNPRTKRTNKGCPLDCGLCEEHKSHTVLGIVDVTNRCNLKCPVCFANANITKKVYEPTPEQIRGMLKNLRETQPVPAYSFQFSGGEPTMRDDLPKLVKIGKELGFNYIMVDTNGIRIAQDRKYLKQLKDAGTDAFYLQFDGLDDEVYRKIRGAPLLKTKIQAIENCRKIGINVVLVVTLMRGINDSQVGGIIKFAAENLDVIKSVNVQPLSLAGSASRYEVKENRITTYDFINLVEKQTKGGIKASDFYPVPSTVPVSRFVEAKVKKPTVAMTTHPICGVGTYIIVKEDGSYTPITKLVDVPSLFNALDKGARELKNEGKLSKKLGMAKLKLEARLLKSIIRYIYDSERRELILNMLKSGTYEAAANFHKNALMIGCMHFMDPWNFDIERVERCVIHYSLPDGRIIPFCSYNNFHRAALEEKFSVSVEEWEKEHGTSVHSYA